MKRVTLVGTALLTVLMLSSAILAQTYRIYGYAFFDTAKTKPARCTDVTLWNGTGCDGGSRDLVTVDAAGLYQFTGLVGDSWYSVRAQWGHTSCAQCDTTGSECDTVVASMCYDVYVDSTDEQQDFVFDIDCECEGD